MYNCMFIYIYIYIIYLFIYEIYNQNDKEPSRGSGEKDRGRFLRHTTLYHGKYISDRYYSSIG